MIAVRLPKGNRSGHNWLMKYDQDKASEQFTQYRDAAEVALDQLDIHVNRAITGGEPATGYAPLAEILERLDIPRWIQHGLSLIHI